MKIQTWHPDMTDKETAELAYWERNLLALLFAEGWYYDDIPSKRWAGPPEGPFVFEPRYPGWRRVLSLEGGSITFHIPDDFDVGGVAQIERNWDGHTTAEKWERVMVRCGVTA